MQDGLGEVLVKLPRLSNSPQTSQYCQTWDPPKSQGPQAPPNPGTPRVSPSPSSGSPPRAGTPQNSWGLPKPSQTSQDPPIQGLLKFQDPLKAPQTSWSPQSLCDPLKCHCLWKKIHWCTTIPTSIIFLSPQPLRALPVILLDALGILAIPGTCGVRKDAEKGGRCRCNPGVG